MRRTLMETLTSLFSETKELRTFPDMPALALMSDGTYRATFHNPQVFEETDRVALRSVQEDGKLVSVYADNALEHAHTRLLKADDRVIAAVSGGADIGLDKGRFAGTLSTGKVAIRVPDGDTKIHEALPTATGEIIGVGVFAIAPEDFPKIPADLDARNLADVARIRAEKIWANQSKMAERSDLFDVAADGIMVEFAPRMTDLRDHLVGLGGKISHASTDGVLRIWFNKSAMSTGEVRVQDIHTRHQNAVAEIARAKEAAERAAHAAKIEKLAKIGIDARNDPKWVSRTENGSAVLLIPAKATGLIALLIENGGVVRHTPGEHKGVTLSAEDFEKIKPVLTAVENEIRAVNGGAKGDEMSMKGRIEATATSRGREKVKDALQTAKRNRRRGSVVVSPTNDVMDPLNPMNPIGVLQMSLWSMEAEHAGAEQQVRDSGLKIKDSGAGEMVIEPPTGGDRTWETPGSASSYGSSPSYDPPSSSYDSGSSSSSSSDSYSSPSSSSSDY